MLYKFKNISIMLLGVVLLQSNIASAQSSATISIPSAQGVAHQYVQAMLQGNTDVVLGLLSEELHKKKLRTLSNPTYPEFLRKFYNNAEYKLENSEIIDSGAFTVNVTIFQNDQVTSQFKLWLKSSGNGSTHIFGETVVTH